MKKELFRKIIQGLLERGADYAEVFHEVTIVESFSNIDNKRIVPGFSEKKGIAIRAIVNNTTYYEALQNTSDEELLEVPNKLLGKKIKDVAFEFSKVDDEGKPPYIKLDPQNSLETLKWAVDTTLNYGQRISLASASIRTLSTYKTIASSKGNFVAFITNNFRLAVEAVAKDGTDQQSARGVWGSALGRDKIFAWLKANVTEKMLLENAKVADALLDAPTIEGGNIPVILPSAGGVIFHEACGHPLEAAAVAKNLSIFSGKKGQMIASPLVTLIDDGTLPGEFGSSKYDDEGQPQQRRVLIEKGVLKNFLIDKANGDLMNEEANGASRRQDFRYVPTSRMSNTFILEGDSTPEDIIKNTKYGFYAKNLGGGQVDPFTGQFNFGVTEGYVVKDGKISHLVKPATLIGNGAEILLKIDMVANDLNLLTGHCGASSGMVPVTDGQPTIRISSMTVGGK